MKKVRKYRNIKNLKTYFFLNIKYKFLTKFSVDPLYFGAHTNVIIIKELYYSTWNTRHISIRNIFVCHFHTTSSILLQTSALAIQNYIYWFIRMWLFMLFSSRGKALGVLSLCRILCIYIPISNWGSLGSVPEQFL